MYMMYNIKQIASTCLYICTYMYMCACVHFTAIKVSLKLLRGLVCFGRESEHWYGLECVRTRVCLLRVSGLLLLCVNRFSKLALRVLFGFRLLDFVETEIVLWSLRITPHMFICSFRLLYLLFRSLLPGNLALRGIACVGFGVLLWYSSRGGILHDSWWNIFMLKELPWRDRPSRREKRR